MRLCEATIAIQSVSNGYLVGVTAIQTGAGAETYPTADWTYYPSRAEAIAKGQELLQTIFLSESSP